MKEIQRLKTENYMIHFYIDKCLYIEFEAYPIYHWTHLPTNTTGFSYIDINNESNQIDYEKGQCLKKFEGSFIIHDMESRLYFTDDEYWGEDLKEMNDLYQNVIIPFVKKYIETYGVKNLMNNI